MPEIQVKDKLVNVEELGVAYDNLNTNKKNIQTAVSDPAASGTAVSFIDSISQDTQGVITPTKKTVSEATTSAAGLLSSTDKTKLDGIEAGAQVNTVTSVNGSTGAVVLDAEDVDAIAKDIPYDFTSNYTGNELIPLYNQTTEQNYSTSINALLSQAGGGGSSQGALVNYKKTVSLSAGSSSQSFTDANITGDMVVLEAIIDTPSAQGSDWDVTTADGSVTISGTVNAATNLTLYFGVGMSTAPSLLTNLSSTSPANILSTAPRPGVMGVLDRENGGTGVNASDLADLRTKLGITTDNIGAVKHYNGVVQTNLLVRDSDNSNNIQLYADESDISGIWITKPNSIAGPVLEIDAAGYASLRRIQRSTYSVVTSFHTNVITNSSSTDTDNLRCIVYGNGLKQIVGIFKVKTGGVAINETIFTVPDAFSYAPESNGSIQGWITIIDTDCKMHIARMPTGKNVILWSGALTGTDSGKSYLINYYYF